MHHRIASPSPSHKRVLSSSRILCLSLALAAPTLFFGQSFTASVRGVVTDSAQAAVPAAKVTVTDVDRNLEHKTQADAMGRYVILALPPGAYTLSAEAAGFQKFPTAAFSTHRSRMGLCFWKFRTAPGAVGPVSNIV